jgi:hypothetical protein
MHTLNRRSRREITEFLLGINFYAFLNSDVKAMILMGSDGCYLSLFRSEKIPLNE